MLEHSQAPSQMMRGAERLGLYDCRKLDMDAPVFKTLQAFIDAQEGPDEGEEQHETCHCVGAECEWPAGRMQGGQAVRGETPYEALRCCISCGEPTCASCFSGDDQTCIDCEAEPWTTQEDER